MAQSFFNQFGRRITKAQLAATTVPGSSTNMLDIQVRGMDRLYVHLTVATAALTGFTIKTKATGDALADTIASVGSDYTAPAGLLVGASGDLTILAIGEGWFILDVTGLDTVSIFATSGGTATLKIEAGGG